MAKQPSKVFFGGKTFLFTGTLSELSRAEAEKIVHANGGSVLSGVTEKLNYLVVGDDAGSKLEKARKMKSVKILNEKDFLKMVKGGGKTGAKITKSTPDEKDVKKEVIDLVSEVIKNLDPTPKIICKDFPLRWESYIFSEDYNFDENHLGLDEGYERSKDKYLKSVRFAIEVNMNNDGSFEYYDGAFMVETHSWCKKLNVDEDYPSFSLISKDFKTFEKLKKFLNDNHA